MAGYSHFAYSSNISLARLKSQHHYISWQGIEPDKWASIWLIKRYVSAQAFFQLLPPNSIVDNVRAIPFDLPGAELTRAPNRSLFSQIKNIVPTVSDELDYIDQIIYDLEVNIWERPKHPHSRWFESMYRALQERYQRDSVPPECYLLFFDQVAVLAMSAEITADIYEERLALTDECPGIKPASAVSIPQLGHREILDLIGTGKNVIFIDTREQAEFDEVHLPGARMLRLREVDDNSVEAFRHADLIVPYCVKDFRGFEVAKAIKARGVDHVATLSPNGLRGWLAAGLPVIKANGNAEAAWRALQLCAMESARCLAEGVL